MSQLRSLPIGVQDFEKLRNRNLLYIDKTQYVVDLLQGGGVYFLSRPRRFGKSLFLSTLGAYFEGQKELFNGLFLEHGEPELAAAQGREAWQKHPVLYLDLNTEEYKNASQLESILETNIVKWERLYGRDEAEITYSARFSGIIRRAYEQTGQQVVLLVDEYDKPLLQAVDKPELYETFRSQLYAIYSNIKSNDRYIRFVFLTGVSRFGKLTIFSGLNSLEDISMDSRYAGLCGVTKKELVENFAPELEALALKLKLSQEATLGELKKRYDGYLFHEEGEHVYNPFSLLNVLKKKELEDYWYATGTPTFLVKYMYEQNFILPDLEGEVMLDGSGLKTSPLITKDPIPILFQTGYLTIREYLSDLGVYRLGFPNEEVRYGFLKNLLYGYSENVLNAGVTIAKFITAIRAGDVDAFMKHLKSIIGGIPYSTTKTENYHEYNGEVAVYLVFSLMGQYTQTEVHCPSGRADAVVHTSNAIYIFEFKMEGAGTPEDALAQIGERGYADRYLTSGKKVVCVGVTFDPKTRNIGEWTVKP